MIHQLHKLSHILFSPRRKPNPAVNQGPDGGLLGRRERVLPRGRLVYRRFKLGDLSPSRRERALQLKLDAWRPFPKARFWIGWQNGVAHVWAWPEDVSATGAIRGERVVPETAIQPTLEQGVRLVAGLDGYEGQFWRDGAFVHSRWWGQPPDERAWAAFMRAAGQMPEPLPEPEQLVWTARPWARPVAAGWEWFIASERPLVAAVAVLLAVAVGWQVGGVWKVERAAEAQRSKLETMQRSAADELAARDAALQHTARAETLMSLLQQVDALTLLDQVTAAMPEGTQLRQWQQEPGRLVFLIESDQPPDPETAVRAFEQLPLLTEVIAERARRATLLELRAEIVRDRSAG